MGITAGYGIGFDTGDVRDLDAEKPIKIGRHRDRNHLPPAVAEES